MIYAEDVNFWKTGRSSPDVWIEKTKKQIENLGGIVKAEGYGMAGGKVAFMLAFSIEQDKFKIVWPILQSYKGDEKSAKIQVATMLYHYIKSVCLYAVIVGARTAFFSHILLEDGRTASQLSNTEILTMAPKFLLLE